MLTLLTHDVGVHDAVPEAGQAPAEQHLPQRGAERGQHDACQEGERGHLRRCGDTRISCLEYVYTGQLVTIKTTRRPSRSDRAPPREQPRMLVKAQHEAATEISL